MNNKAVIIGSGVIGLTTAITLLKNGWQVHLLAASFPPETTSNKAGAIWFPYNVHPPKQAMEWSKIAYERWAQLAKEPKSGVSMVSFTVMEKITQEGLPWWRNALPLDAYEVQTAGLPEGFSMAHVIQVPFIDPHFCMPYLVNWAMDLGLTKEKAKVENLEALCKAYPDCTIINCTGLGARELAHDDTVYAVQGQAIVVERFAEAIYKKADESATAPTYLFTRNNELLLGGTAIPNAEGEVPEELTIEDIQRRCAQIFPAVGQQKVLRHYVGLRPCRPAIRLERDAHLPVIHNYGQGGGGYTASWGCAEEALLLLKE